MCLFFPHFWPISLFSVRLKVNGNTVSQKIGRILFFFSPPSENAWLQDSGNVKACHHTLWSGDASGLAKMQVAANSDAGSWGWTILTLCKNHLVNGNHFTFMRSELKADFLTTVVNYAIALSSWSSRMHVQFRGLKQKRFILFYGQLSLTSTLQGTKFRE